MQYQGMTEMPADDYQQLAEDIRKRGVLQPIVVDKQNRIIDGHHREALAQHFDLDGTREPAYITLADLDDDGEKIARGIKQNLIGRDTTDAVKSHAIKKYIVAVWDRTDDGALIRPETDSEVAAKLGVSQPLVNGVVKNITSNIIYHDRIQAREYYEDNPDASYREVAEQVDASRPTVTEWLKEDFDEQVTDAGGDEGDDEPLNVVSRGASERDKTNEVARVADGGSTTISDTASEAVEDLSKNNTSPQTASKRVEKESAKEEVKKQQQEPDEQTAVVRHVDVQQLLAETDSGDLLLTDPPYTTDVDDIRTFVSSWLPAAMRTLDDTGCAFIFVGAYTDELQTYLSQLDELGLRERTQVLVWTYRNTLGQTPSDQYKRNWQAILFIQSDPTTDIDAPLTSEKWAVQDINAPDGRHDGRHHKWQKPREAIDRFIRHTTEEGDTVIDPFVGTGTTALVAAELGRQVIAGDNSSKMLDIAVDRGCVRNE
jgi:site-specific DNA-adenine methylase